MVLTKRTYLFYSLNILFQNEERYNKALNSLRTNDGNKTYADFRLNDQEQIIYTPLNLRVVPENEIEETLKTEFEENGTGREGLVTFYRFLCNKYIGITRKDVSDFLKTQYQYNAKQRRIVTNKPVGLARHCGEVFAIDLIDMSLFTEKNNGNHYILTCIDTFSRKIWLQALRKKTARSVLNAFKKIVERLDEPITFIHSVLSDNGTEFLAEFENYLKKNNIHIRKIVSHSPQGNAVCERANREVRRILRSIFVKNQKNVWYDELTNVENIKNSSYHTSIKTEPDKVWDARRTNNIVGDEILPYSDDINHQTASNLRQKAIRDLEKYKDQGEYQVGDRVRVSMLTIYSDVRRIFKAGQRKQLVVFYTPSIFRISRVIHPRGINALHKLRYELQHEKSGQFLAIPNKNDKRILKEVFASELAPVTENEHEDENFTDKKALELNQCEERNTDLVLVP